MLCSAGCDQSSHAGRETQLHALQEAGEWEPGQDLDPEQGGEHQEEGFSNLNPDGFKLMGVASPWPCPPDAAQASGPTAPHSTYFSLLNCSNRQDKASGWSVKRGDAR